MIRAFLLLVAAATAFASEWTDLPIAVFTEGCSLLPTRLLPAMKPPPLYAPSNAAAAREYLYTTDVCRSVTCPRAPTQCYYNSECIDGACLPFVAKPFGSYCDDGNDLTMNDVCSGDGSCIGQRFSCPVDVTASVNPSQDRKRVFWSEPVPSFGDVSFSVSSSSSPGDYFYIGVTEVVYDAFGVDPQGQPVAFQCVFHVRVQEDCDDDCCSRSDGLYSRGSVTTVDNFVSALDRHEFLYQPDSHFTCLNRQSVCDSPRSFLPPRMMAPPPLAPKLLLDPVVTTTTPRTTTTTTTTTTSGTEFCTFRTVDVAFVLDASGSVGFANFELAKDFIIDAINLLDVGSTRVRVAGMMFHAEPLPQFDFDDSFSKSQIEAFVRGFTYPTDISYGTATGSAMNYVTDNLLQTSAGWRDIETIVYIVTDGVSQETNQEVIDAANRLHASGASVVAVGITDLVDRAQLEVIAGQASNVVEVSDFDQLNDAIRDDLISRVCSSTTSTTTTTPADGPTLELCEGKTTSVTQQSCDCRSSLTQCHTCAYNGQVIAASCSICRSGHYLHQGQCVSSCPSGYNEVGSGSFGRLCVEQPTSSSAPSTSSTASLYVDDTCIGRSFMISGGTCNCRATISSCHSCDYNFDSGIIPASCSLCRDGQYLLDGQCVSACPSAYSEQGSGSYGRVCQAISISSTSTSSSTMSSTDTCDGRSTTGSSESCNCRTVIDSCQTCGFNHLAPNSIVPATCSKCRDATYLLDGECVASCPSGYSETGSGNFGRTCEPDSSSSSTSSTALSPTDTCDGRSTTGSSESCTCRAVIDSCQTCGFNPFAPSGIVPATCTKCRDAKYLLDGECVDSCPTGYDEVGSGSFGRTCEVQTAPSFGEVCQGRSVVSGGQSCDCDADCYECSYSFTHGAGQCNTCKNFKHNLDGECVDSCPSGYDVQGSGRFGRECVASSAGPVQLCEGRFTDLTNEACRCDGDCHECSWQDGVAGVCNKCKNGAFLFDGDCVASCPSGFAESGSGAFGRECLVNRRRSVLSESESVSSAHVSTTSTLLSCAAVFGVVALAMVAMFRRRQDTTTLPVVELSSSDVSSVAVQN